MGAGSLLRGGKAERRAETVPVRISVRAGVEAGEKDPLGQQSNSALKSGHHVKEKGKDESPVAGACARGRMARRPP